MRLLTHNTLRNHAADAKGQGYPLRITTCQQVRVDSTSTLTPDQQVAFVQNILPILHWDALVEVRAGNNGSFGKSSDT